MKIKRKRRWLYYACLAIAAFLLIRIILFSAAFIYPELRTQNRFGRLASPLVHTYDLFDLGVTDANNDAYLDIFTLNHSARQDLLIYNQDGTYHDKLSQWNLDQDEQFPGLEDSDTKPEFNSPGLYVYRHNFRLYLYNHQLETPVAGKLKLSLPVTIHSQREAKIEISETQLSSETKTTEVSFLLPNNAEVVLDDFPEIPHNFELARSIPLTAINLGQKNLIPEQHSFTLMWRDRHTMAWSDVNNDGMKDVFIGRGGVRGKISQVAETLSDELFIRGSTTFEDRIARFKLTKQGCPARKSAWVDYNGDNRLDLYISCGRLAKDTTVYPNLLYQRLSDDSFVNVAPQVGLDLPDAGYFQWLDVDGDRDPDLIIAGQERVVLYKNNITSFEPEVIAGFNGKKLVKLAIADFDGNGSLDGYGIIEGGNNQVLINREGMLQFKAAADYGLPETGLDASWVDYDNDAALELHVVPFGLYGRRNYGKFHALNLLDFRRPLFSIWNARSVWFDADNDGDRELLMAYQQTPSLIQPRPSIQERLKNQIFKRDTSRIWQSKIYENKGSKNHWLQVILKGSDLNAEALGALISVETDTGVQTQLVGATDGTRYSQGHYRSYFGTGNNAQIKRITVQWADGSTQNLKKVDGDRIITIAKNSS